VHDLRIFAIVLWLSLPTVMYGGYALLGRLTSGGQLTPFQATIFRAGHAHAGVLLLLALLYDVFLGRTTVSHAGKMVASLVLGAGVLAQSGGFFVHLAVGKPGQRSVGTTITTVGALLLAGAVLFLVYALIARW
jgi:hypothetical protein